MSGIRLARTLVRRRRVRALALIAIALGIAGAPVLGQANSAALDLLLPIGARGTALGAAAVAEEGSEAIWWNPAGLARLTKPQFAIDHFTRYPIDGGEALSLILPAGAVGVFGIAARYFDYGTTEARSTENEEVGFTSTRSVAFGGSFAAAFAVGIRSQVAWRPTERGHHIPAVPVREPLLGLLSSRYGGGKLHDGVRGPRCAVSALRDQPVHRRCVAQQHRPGFPDTRPAAGGSPPSAGTPRNHLRAGGFLDSLLKLRLTAEFVSAPTRRSKEVRFGGEATYLSQKTLLSVRAGYTREEEENPGRGPSVGIGLARDRVQLDFTRLFESFSTNLSVPPTFISIRLSL